MHIDNAELNILNIMFARKVPLYAVLIAVFSLKSTDNVWVRDSLPF